MVGEVFVPSGTGKDRGEVRVMLRDTRGWNELHGESPR